MEAKFVTYFTAHQSFICWLASCVGVCVTVWVRNKAVSPYFAQFSFHLIEFRCEVYIFWYFLFIIHWKEALNFDIIYSTSQPVKCLLKYQLLVHFCTKKYSTRGTLGIFDGEVIRVKIDLLHILITNAQKNLKWRKMAR